MSGRKICNITLVKDDDGPLDIFVTSHPDGNHLDKIARNMLEIFSVALQEAKERSDRMRQDQVKS